jgi:3-deoxy-manno-octulosonate cytidylyltransferase (CMP-KDO synthetase)
MRSIVIIPARMASLRLPGKPLADIAGTPMIVHVWRRAAQADIGPVVVAAGDQEIVDAVEAAGGRAVLTPPDLASGSDRVFFALQSIDPNQEYGFVLNVQGDLPLLNPDDLRVLEDGLNSAGAEIVTLAAEITNPAEAGDPNVVKAVISFEGQSGAPRRGRALYFTRASAPSGEGPLYHHIGLYGFQRPALTRFVKLPPSDLEKQEKLEQLRALEAGMRIDVMLVDSIPLGVDTPADLAAARRLIK